jgi:hypothetical protein
MLMAEASAVLMPPLYRIQIFLCCRDAFGQPPAACGRWAYLCLAPLIIFWHDRPCNSTRSNSVNGLIIIASFLLYKLQAFLKLSVCLLSAVITGTGTSPTAGPT